MNFLPLNLTFCILSFQYILLANQLQIAASFHPFLLVPRPSSLKFVHCLPSTVSCSSLLTVTSMTSSSTNQHDGSSSSQLNNTAVPSNLSSESIPSGDSITLRQTNRIAIVPVRCDSTRESPLLRKGVQSMFQLYFDELYEMGCDLGFQGFQSEWTDLPGKYDFEKRGGLFVAVSIPMDEGFSQAETSGVGTIPDGSANRNTVAVAQEMDPLSLEFNMKLDQLLQHGKAMVVGCIAIRPLTETCGEVKRMYIKKSHRRMGVGRMLADAIIQHAWGGECRFEEIKLDSLERLVGAVKLYEGMGFERIDPYCECPEDDHVCMNLFKRKK